MPASEPALSVPRLAALAAAAAAAFMLAFPPYDLWPLIVVPPVALAVIARRARSVRVALAIVFAAHWLMWLRVDRWLIDVTMLGYPLLAAYMALYPALFVVLMRGLRRHARLSAIPAVVALPVVWVGLEALRGELVLDGYPWFLLAHPLIHAPVLAQSADLFGTYFVSLIAVVPAGALVDLLERPPRRRMVATSAGALTILALAGGYGAWRLGQTAPLREGPRILVIQTNVPQSNKMAWTLEARRRDFDGFVALTRSELAAAGPDVDVIAWPETMFPARGLEVETMDLLRRWNQRDELGMMEDLVAFAAAIGTPMVVGSASYDGLGVDAATRRFIWTGHYNSAYLVDGAPPYARYDKHVLTPFGEVMPYISAWPWLEQKLLALGATGMEFSLDAGPDIRLLELPFHDRVVRAGTPICFEDAVASVCRDMVYGDRGEAPGGKAAGLLLNLSNDGWFGAGDDVRAQHAQIARFRAIENRVPVVRCVNTGYSVSIDSAGRVVGTIGEGEYGEPRRPGGMIARTTLDTRHTLYGRIGAVFPWACAAADALLLAALLVARRTKGRNA